MAIGSAYITPKHRIQNEIYFSELDCSALDEFVVTL